MALRARLAAADRARLRSALDNSALAAQNKSVRLEAKAMARAKSESNGRLEEAMTNLVQAQANLAQTQAAFVQNQAAFQARIAETDRQLAELQRINAEHFARIEERFTRLEMILLEHSRILAALPDAVREKIGFKARGQSATAE